MVKRKPRPPFICPHCNEAIYDRCAAQNCTNPAVNRVYCSRQCSDRERKRKQREERKRGVEEQWLADIWQAIRATFHRNYGHYPNWHPQPSRPKLGPLPNIVPLTALGLWERELPPPFMGVVNNSGDLEEAIDRAFDETDVMLGIAKKVRFGKEVQDDR